MPASSSSSSSDLPVGIIDGGNLFELLHRRSAMDGDRTKVASIDIELMTMTCVQMSEGVGLFTVDMISRCADVVPPQATVKLPDAPASCATAAHAPPRFAPCYVRQDTRHPVAFGRLIFVLFLSSSSPSFLQPLNLDPSRNIESARVADKFGPTEAMSSISSASDEQQDHF